MAVVRVVWDIPAKGERLESADYFEVERRPRRFALSVKQKLCYDRRGIAGRVDRDGYDFYCVASGIPAFAICRRLPVELYGLRAYDELDFVGYHASRRGFPRYADGGGGDARVVVADFLPERKLTDGIAYRAASSRRACPCACFVFEHVFKPLYAPFKVRRVVSHLHHLRRRH